MAERPYGPIAAGFFAVQANNFGIWGGVTLWPVVAHGK